MENMFYFQNRPYHRNIPQSFNSLNKSINSVNNKIDLNQGIKKLERGIGMVKQIIPIYKQVTPMYGKLKTTLASLSKFVTKTGNINSNLGTNINKSIKTITNFRFNQDTPNPPKF